MAIHQNLITNADKVKFSSVHSMQKIKKFYDGSALTISLAAVAGDIDTLTIPHGLDTRPYPYVLFSINGTSWFSSKTILRVNGSVDYCYLDCYTTSTNVVISAINQGSAPSSKTIRVRYWLMTS